MRYAENAVTDTDIIIKLANLRQADKLLRLFGAVHLPRAVRREAKLHGRQRRRRDMHRFRCGATPCDRYDRTTFMLIHAMLHRRNPHKSHVGESEAISQALLARIPVLLTDDADAQEVATDRDLEVLSSWKLVQLIAALD